MDTGKRNEMEVVLTKPWPYIGPIFRFLYRQKDNPLLVDKEATEMRREYFGTWELDACVRRVTWLGVAGVVLCRFCARRSPS